MKQHRFKLNIGSSLFVALVALMLASCSTQKNTFVSRQYHNVTAYFNYYYNANDIHTTSLKKAEKQFSYNYTLPVPMLLLGEEQMKSAVSGDMDRAIEKCTNLISKHSITVKPQRSTGLVMGDEKKFYNQNEFVRWAREAWYLAAQSQAWKGDLDRSQLAFEYISIRYPNTPMWYSAQVWLARLAILRSSFVEAGDKLNEISKNYKLPRTNDFRHLLNSTYAFYYLEQNDIVSAMPYISKSIRYASKRPDRLRYTYLLAQLQQQQGDNKKAAENYRKALHLSPSYEMAFSIKINSIALGGVKGESLKKELLKLARDDKNRDYLDQLYYTLGNMEWQGGNEAKAIEYYKLSARRSTNNDNQKGMSYLVLANYHFEKAIYVEAQGYFDSSIALLDRNYPNYDEIATKTRFLGRLVDNLNTISKEDSLLRVASMPKGERDALIASLIAKVREAEEAKRLEEQEEQQRAMQYQQQQRYNAVNADEKESGKWYFYNQNSLSYGQSEFQMKWGKRKLEDNWRRKNKAETMGDNAFATQTDTAGTGTGAAPKKELSNKSPEFYLVNLPMSDSLKRVANVKIKESMLRVAEIYQADLSDLNEAKKAYQMFIMRYPDDPLAASVYYSLYKIALEQENASEAQQYKAQLIASYPQSPYAMMLANPEYAENLKKQQSIIEQKYENAYNLYNSGDYSKAHAAVVEALTKHGESKLVPKFLLLDALCTGKTVGASEMKKALAEISSKYPKTDEGQQAGAIVKTIEARELSLATEQQTTTDTPAAGASVVQQQIFSQPQGEHMVVVLVPKKTDVNQLKFNVITFNVDNFIETDLNVSNAPFSDFVEMITITGLKDLKMASNYFARISTEEQIFASMEKNEYQMFVISTQNFAVFLEDKSISNYLDFFKKNY